MIPVGLPSNAIWAIALVAVWIIVIIGARIALGLALDRYEKHLAESTDDRGAARRRTSVTLIPRLVTLFLVLIAAWSVLSLFPETAAAAGALLASSAVFALILGVALTGPLGNLGSGIVLVWTQPLRLDDRISVEIPSGQTHTGTVDKIGLAYTRLVTDEGRKIFVPNRQMVKNVVTNHSRGDRRRAINVRLPIALDATFEEACRVAFEAARAVQTQVDDQLELRVNVVDVTEAAAWLDVAGFVPATADVSSIATDIRKHALARLAEKGLLPPGSQKPAS
jgi:small conductance mechanosensitive channel